MTIRSELESLSRDELVSRARRAGVKRAEVMTRLELVDEILRLSVHDPGERKRVRGFLGVARDLVASIVEQGLNLPDAAAMIRGEISFQPRPAPPPVASVTLAEIFAAQGHREKALGILDEVLTREPEHEVAERLWERLGGAPRQAAQASDAPEAPSEDEAESRPTPAAWPEAGGGDEAAEAKSQGVASAAGQEAEPDVRAEAPIAVLCPAGSSAWTIAWDLGRHRRDQPPAVRAVEVTPAAGGTTRLDHVLEGSGPRGQVTLRVTDEAAVVRAAVGWTTEAGFRAAVVAIQLADRPEVGGAPEIVWSPRRRIPSDEDIVRVLNTN